MGYIRHNAIIATAWQNEAAAALVDFASSIGAEAIAGGEQVNGYLTVCITPDGSKEGWQSSDEGDARREKIRQWLDDADSRDQYFEWVEVVYGNDDAEASVAASRWEEA